MIHYKSYHDLSQDIASGIQRVPGVDMVVGVPRSGIIPATMIASYLNISFIDLDAFLFTYAKRSGFRTLNSADNDGKTRVLVVDDSINSGSELRRVRDLLKSYSDQFEFVFCVIYGVEENYDKHELVDFVFSVLPQPRFFQWNYRNHPLAGYTCFDIDGVLCIDPTKEQNDDGPKYRDFLKNATPLFIPKQKISSLVTSRLEKYRGETEEWLDTHGVQYDELIMLDLPSAEERRRLKANASFKAEVYQERSEILFIESEWWQAKAIAKDTDKPVICTQNDVFLYGRDHLETLQNTNELYCKDKLNTEKALRSQIAKLSRKFAEMTENGDITWLKLLTFRAKEVKRSRSLWKVASNILRD